ncbi:hypothetical protein KN1_25350 [Stygiolobus caldivivus]|uniref:Uncharacterized protein n=1 Tax=Stygiolobus caldivivus TaxID=2824673 RepID=A0A8D5U8D1_9CREN|nr:hypothetical protein KN1_25350 [Stygiolobus caldivivus]
MLPICYSSLPLLVYGILTPIYTYALEGKLSNEKAFYFAWVTAPFLVAYFYVKSIMFIPLLLIFNIIAYIIVFNNKYKYIVSVLLSASILCQLIYSLIVLHITHA